MLVVVTVSFLSWQAGVRYEGFLKRQLPLWVSKASGGVYKITVRDVHVGITGRRIRLRGIHIWPDDTRLSAIRQTGAAPKRLFEARIDEMELRGTVWEALVTDSVLTSRRLRVHNPSITVLEGRDTGKLADQPGAGSGFQGISIRNVEVDGIVLRYYRRNSLGNLDASSTGGRLTAADFQIHRNEQGKMQQISRALVLTLGLIRMQAAGSKYRLWADSLAWTPADTQVQVHRFGLEPVAHLKNQHVQYQLHIRHGILHGFSVSHTLRQRNIEMSELTLEGAQLQVATDRRMPRSLPLRRALFPQELLRLAPIPIHIGMVRIYQSDIVYREASARTGLQGQFSFDDLRGTISPVVGGTSMHAIGKSQISVQLNGVFQQHSAMEARANLSLNDSLNAFDLRARLKGLEDYQVRGLAKALGLIDITSLHVDSADFHVWGNNSGTSCRFRGEYQDLRVQILKMDTLTRAMQKRGLLSFVANRIVLHSSNPLPGSSVRQAASYLHRDTTEPFFRGLWKSLFECVLQTTIADRTALERAKQKAATKPQRLQERQRRREERRRRREARRARKDDAVL
jgi:hypothetical protein